MNEIIYLDGEDIREIHEEALALYGGLSGEYESGLIDFVAEKPSMVSFGTELYPDLFMKAAIYLEGFATHQYFCDGNKRTALNVALTFLAINGYILEMDKMALYRLTKQVANKRVDINELAKIIKLNCKAHCMY